MVSRKALRQQRVDRLQFVFPAFLVTGIVAFATACAFESRDQQHLQQLAVVVLEDVANAAGSSVDLSPGTVTLVGPSETLKCGAFRN